MNAGGSTGAQYAGQMIAVGRGLRTEDGLAQGGEQPTLGAALEVLGLAVDRLDSLIVSARELADAMSGCELQASDDKPGARTLPGSLVTVALCRAEQLQRGLHALDHELLRIRRAL